MIGANSNFAELQLRLLEAARKLAEARALRRPAPDNTANWRSAGWLWPDLGPNPGPNPGPKPGSTIGQE